MKSDTVIKQEGFNALKEKLGDIDMERFIVIINHEKLDYTKWRQSLFDGMTIDEISTAAEKYSQEKFNDKPE